MIRGEISGQSGPPSAAGVRSGGAPWTVRQLSSRPSGGSPTARRAAAPGGPGDRPRAVPAVSARCRARREDQAVSVARVPANGHGARLPGVAIAALHREARPGRLFLLLHGDIQT